MWSRAVFKKRAKNILSKSYWISFLVCLVGGIITGAFGTFNFLKEFRKSGHSGSLTAQHSILEMFSHSAFSIAFIFIALSIFFFVMVFSLAYYIFVAYPVRAGMSNFFLENRKGDTQFINLFYAFKKDRYIDIVKGMAWQLLFQFLWTMLFVIPGIIKFYSYFMVPYILADNPKIGYKRALKLSMDMTDGYKWDIFVLHLSFLGWYLLGSILCLVGILFVNPYFQAANAEMYGTLRKNAVEKGLCKPEELNLSERDYSLDAEGFNY